MSLLKGMKVFENVNARKRTWILRKFLNPTSCNINRSKERAFGTAFRIPMGSRKYGAWLPVPPQVNGDINPKVYNFPSLLASSIGGRRRARYHNQFDCLKSSCVEKGIGLYEISKSFHRICAIIYDSYLLFLL